MHNNILAAATANTIAGLLVGAWFVVNGYPWFALLALVTGFMAAVTIIGGAMKK